MTSFAVPARPAGLAGVAAGVILTALGVTSTIDPELGGSAWFVIAGVAIFLFVAAVLGLRAATAENPTARRALAGSAVAFTVFGLAHFYAVLDVDLAIVLFSVFMVLGSIGLIIAGIALARQGVGRGWTRWVPLVCGVWPVLTIPAGAAIGDVPHFGAITVWGLCWVALGASLLSVPAGDRAAARVPQRSR